MKSGFFVLSESYTQNTMGSNYEYSADRMLLGNKQKYIIINDSCLLIVQYIVFQNLNIIKGNSVTKISRVGVIS